MVTDFQIFLVCRACGTPFDGVSVAVCLLVLRHMCWGLSMPVQHHPANKQGGVALLLLTAVSCWGLFECDMSKGYQQTHKGLNVASHAVVLAGCC